MKIEPTAYRYIKAAPDGSEMTDVYISKSDDGWRANLDLATADAPSPQHAIGWLIRDAWRFIQAALEDEAVETLVRRQGEPDLAAMTPAELDALEARIKGILERVRVGR